MQNGDEVYIGIPYWEIDHQAKLWNLKTLLSRLKHGLFSYSKVNCLKYVFKTPISHTVKVSETGHSRIQAFKTSKHEWRLFCDPCKVLKITGERCVQGPESAQ